MARSRYGYDPSTVAAIVVAVLYTIVFIATFIQWIRLKAWVWVLMVLSAAMEALGYLIRIYSVNNLGNRNAYIAQFCLIVLAPVLMAAAIYVIFARLVFHVIPPAARTIKLLWVPARFITLIFVVCDLIAFLLQLWGAVTITSVQVTDTNIQEKLDRGKMIALIGLGVQIACFGLFCVVAIRLHFTSQRFATEFTSRLAIKSDDKTIRVGDVSRPLKTHWRPLLLVINVTCTLILIRSIFRVAEFAQGREGYIDTHEWCLYVFDALPVFPCVAAYLYWHPAYYLPYLSFRLPAYLRKKGGDYMNNRMEGTVLA